VAVAQRAGGDDDRAADAPRRSTTVPAQRPPRTTVDTPERTAPPNPSDGDVFTDPEGSYTITIGPGWIDLPSTFVAEVETWGVADAGDGFTPNVNVLTQEVPDMDQDDYMELSLDSLATIDGEMIDQAFVTGPHGNSLGLIEYVAQPQGVRSELHFVGVFDVRDGTAVVGTFTAPQDRFEELWPAVEPYLLTLQATG
jgi:hypothetical protein